MVSSISGSGYSTEDLLALQKQRLNKASSSGQTSSTEQMPPPPPGGKMDSTDMAKDIFSKADADGDGTLTKEELAAVAPKDNKGPSVDDLFAAADSDSDGSISVDDLAASLQKSFEAHAPSANSTTVAGYNNSGTTVTNSKSSFNTLA